MWQSGKCQTTRMYRPGSVAGFQIVENPLLIPLPALPLEMFLSDVRGVYQSQAGLAIRICTRIR